MNDIFAYSFEAPFSLKVAKFEVNSVESANRVY